MQCLTRPSAVAFVACAALVLSSFAAGGKPAPGPKSPWPPKPNPGWATPVRVVRTIDGDTLVCEIRRTVRVRLLDCWTAELKSKDPEDRARARAARDALSQRADGRQALLYVPSSATGDLGRVLSLGRALGHVWIEADDTSLSQHQVDAGHASRTRPKP